MFTPSTEGDVASAQWPVGDPMNEQAELRILWLC